MTFEELKNQIIRFCNERNWAQYHSPKNLSMCLACEAAELLEIFQWMTEEESRRVMENPEKAAQVRHEIADILYNVLLLSHKLGIDLAAAGKEKMALNIQKYPIAKSKGSNRKYNEI